MQDLVKIAVVGVGLMGKTHIKYINSSLDAKLDCLVAPNSKENYEAAKCAGVPIYHSITDCIAERKIDGIILATPNQVHASHAEICINNNIPVLIEKPITSSLIEGKNLLDKIELTNAKVLIGHHRAHNPLIDTASLLINSGKLGKLISIMGSAQFYKPDNYFVEGPWRAEIGGGPIFINLIHEIDTLRRLMGEISQVQAFLSNGYRKFDVEDTAVINFVFKNGALGTFMLSDASATPKSWEQTTQENPRFPYYKNEDCYLISGTRGSLGVPTMRLRYYSEGAPSSWWSPFEEELILCQRKDPLELQLKHFVDIIKLNINPKVTAYDGFMNLLIADAIKKSAHNKTIINIDPL
jgi:predicted dehydrogenase